MRQRKEERRKQEKGEEKEKGSEKENTIWSLFDKFRNTSVSHSRYKIRDKIRY